MGRISKNAYESPLNLPKEENLYKDGNLVGKSTSKLRKALAVPLTVSLLAGAGICVKEYFDAKREQKVYEERMAKLPQYTPEEIDRVIKKVRPPPEDPKFGWKVVKVQTITDKYYLRRVEKFYKKCFGKEIKIRRTFIPTIGRPDGTILGTMSDVLETESGELIYPWR